MEAKTSIDFYEHIIKPIMESAGLSTQGISEFALEAKVDELPTIRVTYICEAGNPPEFKKVKKRYQVTDISNGRKDDEL